MLIFPLICGLQVSLTILEGWVVVMHLKHEERVMLWVQSVRQGETHVIRKKLACNHTRSKKLKYFLMRRDHTTRECRTGTHINFFFVSCSEQNRLPTFRANRPGHDGREAVFPIDGHFGRVAGGSLVGDVSGENLVCP
jgi:hypothetical protein